VVLKLALKVFFCLFFQTFWPKWPKFFGHFKKGSVCGRKQNRSKVVGVQKHEDGKMCVRKNVADSCIVSFHLQNIVRLHVGDNRTFFPQGAQKGPMLSRGRKQLILLLIDEATKTELAQNSRLVGEIHAFLNQLRQSLVVQIESYKKKVIIR